MVKDSFVLSLLLALAIASYSQKRSDHSYDITLINDSTAVKYKRSVIVNYDDTSFTISQRLVPARNYPDWRQINTFKFDDYTDLQIKDRSGSVAGFWVGFLVGAAVGTLVGSLTFTPDTKSSDWESLHRTAYTASGLLLGGAAVATIGSIAGNRKIVIPLHGGKAERNKQLEKYKYNFK